MHLQQAKVALAITLTFAGFIIRPALVRTQPQKQVVADLSQEPDLGTPDGNPRGGGTRPGTVISCQKTQESLTALTPSNGRGLTVSEHPTFWFYIPYESKFISSAEFSLRDYEQQEHTVYRATLDLSETPGIVSVSVPTDKKHSLERNKRYHWYLELDCESSEKNANPSITIDGWVKTVAPNADLQSQLATVKQQEYIAYKANNILYDALNNLAQLHFANPQNSALNTSWTDLLKSFGLADLAKKPIAVSVSSTKK